MDKLHYVLAVLVMMAVTVALRFLPFYVFGGGKKTPGWVSYLGTVLPPAAMAMLVVYCFKSVSFAAFPYGIPELISAAVVVGLHVWKRNTLLSVIGGTACYMFLIQTVIPMIAG